ncbi:FKBP-type peptidyl-prolyl cis-trans isomerase [Paludisphaera rhizosphaerae]|uniref:FKBP-type peptidyl-prolyl cis-trans isomerase n=1 Tax=Paludisphaera rhizosphaerae TaxID=2711216 RepID=UPI001F0ED575|nr:FKBP-type peptidyl-prolyl cis-trans isomerase [Paludisphaera rhizosphaerae]
MRIPKPRLTIGGMLALVALAAVMMTYLRPAGTRIVEVKVGTGPPVKQGDSATVHYVGTLADGTKFDSSRVRNVPVEFSIGTGHLIRGWDVGLIGMKSGGIRKLIIPPEEGYGALKAGRIPPNSTLYFEVELLGIKPALSAAPGSGPP